MFTINSSQVAFTGKQRLAVYQNGQLPPYPLRNGVLAPSTDVTRPLYNCGRYVALYGDDAPDGLSGLYVNYDPASDVPSQAICVGIVGDPFADGLTGIDLTSTDTATETVCRTGIALFLTGSMFYNSTLVAENSTAATTGFLAQFIVANVSDVYVGTTLTEVISIQGANNA